MPSSRLTPTLLSVGLLALATPAFAQRPAATSAEAPRAPSGVAGASTNPVAPPGPVTPASAGLPGVTGVPRGAGARMDSPAHPAPYAPAAPDARVSFNLQDASLVEVVRAVSDLTGRRFVVHGRIRDVRFTLYSPTQVTVHEAYQAFLTALESNGLTVIPEAGYSVIEESAAAVSRPLPVYRDGDEQPADAQFVTRVHQLRVIPAHDAAGFLAAFRSRDGMLTAHAASNTLVLTDTGANVRRMLRLLDEIDVPRAAPPATRAHGGSAHAARGADVPHRGGGPRR